MSVIEPRTSVGTFSGTSTGASISNRLAVNEDESKSPFANFTEQFSDGISAVGQSFSDLFSGAKAQGTSANSRLINSKGSGVVNNETGLFSSLGLDFSNGNSAENAEQLGSGLSVASMQNNLLSTLQSNVFNTNKLTDEVAGRVSNAKSSVKDGFNTLTQLPEQESSLFANISEYSFGDNGLDLNDGFDTINVLQHIPVLSSIYQEESGQEISAMAKLGGGYLYGGVLGFAYSAVDLAFEGFSGDTIGDTLVDFNYSELFFAEDATKPASFNTSSASAATGPYMNRYRDEIVYQNRTVAK